MVDGVLMGPRRAETAGEGGFTIVEMMVALSLMALTMVSISGVFFSGLKAASAINTRTAAVALATRETEAVRAVPYDSIGFFDSQGTPPGPFPLFETLPAVSLGATGIARLVPTGTATIGPVTYSIRRHLLWVSANGPSTVAHPGTSYAEAYKKTVVIVTWTDGSGAHTLRQDSIVYPGGRGVYGGAGSSSTTTTAPPVALAPGAADLLSVLPALAPQGQTQLNLTWTAPALIPAAPVTQYIVQQANDSAFSSGLVTSPLQPASATTYQASGLSPGTTYHFRVLAYSSASLYSPSNMRLGSTDPLPGAPASTCLTTGVSLTGSGTLANQGLSTKTYLKNGTGQQSLEENLQLVVSYSGTCSTTFTVRGVGPEGFAALGSPYSLTAGAGNTFKVTIPASSTSWPALGVNTFTVLQAGAPVTPAVQKTFLFCSGNGQPSSDANLC